MCTVNAGDTARPTQEPIRVVVADDHVLYRRGLQTVVTQEEDIDIVGEASDGQEAIDRTVELLPDVVLMDVRMPRISGIEACQPSRARCRRPRSSC
jgi:two-component system NarL family response regulator